MGQLSRPAIYEARVAECEAAAATAVDARVRAKLLQLAGRWRRLARKNDKLQVSTSARNAPHKNEPPTSAPSLSSGEGRLPGSRAGVRLFAH